MPRMAAQDLNDSSGSGSTGVDPEEQEKVVNVDHLLEYVNEMQNAEERAPARRRSYAGIRETTALQLSTAGPVEHFGRLLA